MKSFKEWIIENSTINHKFGGYKGDPASDFIYDSMRLISSPASRRPFVGEPSDKWGYKEWEDAVIIQSRCDSAVLSTFKKVWKIYENEVSKEEQQ